MKDLPNPDTSFTNINAPKIVLKQTAAAKTVSELNEEIDAEAAERNNMKRKMVDESLGFA